MDTNHGTNGNLADALPEMVRPAPGAAGDVPIKTGSRRTLGMKVRSKESFYFVATTGGMGRYSRRFPVTEDGWQAAWRAFATEDPDAAQAYRDAPRVPPGSSGGMGQVSGPSYGGGTAADAHPGMAFLVTGGLGVVVAGVLFANADVGALALFAFVMGVASLALMMVGAAAEGVLLARRTE